MASGPTFPRSSGILLHPTSLPGRFGIGDLGVEAYRFVDFLKDAGQRLWQVLPLGPTGYGDSPYQCFSAFAGNPLLISLERLVEKGLLNAAALHETAVFPEEETHYGRVIPWKMDLLARAARNFLAGASGETRARFETFCAAQSRMARRLRAIHGAQADAQPRVHLDPLGAGRARAPS